MKTDFEVIQEMLNREEFDGAVGGVEEVALYRKGSVDKKHTHKMLQIEADNGKGHGQKGHRKGYLSFIFTMDGKLSEIVSYAPSQEDSFKYFDNKFNEES